jgi:hypothetical protein
MRSSSISLSGLPVRSGRPGRFEILSMDVYSIPGLASAKLRSHVMRTRPSRARPPARLKPATVSFSGRLDRRQQLRLCPDIAATSDQGTALSFHGGYLCASAPEAFVEESR